MSPRSKRKVAKKKIMPSRPVRRPKQRPDDVALSVLLGGQEHLGQDLKDMRQAQANDPALSVVLGKLANIEDRLDKILKRLDMVPAAPQRRAPLPLTAPLAVAPDSDLPQFLARIPLFSKHSAIECAVLATYFEPKALGSGGVLFEQGAFGDAMYLLRSGTLEIYKMEGANSIAVATLHPGALVGEMALVENKPRSANVRASQDAQLLSLSRSAYQRLKLEQPQVATKFQDELLTLLSVRLRQTTEKLTGRG